MNTENLRFNLFEIFDNMMGAKKKFQITDHLDVYTTRKGDKHRVIRVSWEVMKSEQEQREDASNGKNHSFSHYFEKLFPYTTEGMYAAFDYLERIPENAI